MGDDLSKPAARDGDRGDPPSSEAASPAQGFFPLLAGGSRAPPASARHPAPAARGAGPLGAGPLGAGLPCSLGAVAGVPAADWVTQTLATVWPFVSPAMRNVLTEDVIPMLPPQVAGMCRIQSFDLGRHGPVLRPLSVTPCKDGTELRVEIEVSYNADVDVALDVGVCVLGVSRVEFGGTLVVVAQPLLQEVPLAGALQMFFLKQPTFDLRFKDTAAIAEIPAIKRSLLDSIGELLRNEMVAPHASVIAVNPDLPLDICDPVGLRCIDPQMAATIRLLGGRSLCRWLRKRPGAPLSPETTDVRVTIRIGDVEWNSAVFEQCTGEAFWEDEALPKLGGLAAAGNALQVLVANPGQTVSIDVFDDSRLCGAEERHLASLALSFEELSAAGAAEPGAWLTLQTPGSAVGNRSKPPALRLGVASVELGLGAQGSADAGLGACLAAPRLGAPLCGALGVRLGGISAAEDAPDLSAEERVAALTRAHRARVRVRLSASAGDLGASSSPCSARVSRASEPQTWAAAPPPTTRLRLPVREHRVVQRLQSKGWDAKDIADLIERPVEIVKNELDPDAADEALKEAEREAKSKILDSWYINDMLWLEVPHADAAQQGSQVIHFEVRDSHGSHIADSSMTLLEAANWPEHKWFEVLGVSGKPEDTILLQLVVRFKPCIVIS